MRHVKWGIIGLGNIATKFAEAFKYSTNAKLLAVASKDENKIKYFKEKFNLEHNYCFDNYEKLIKSKEIDIVYIALPNSLHFEWISRCIENNKKILVEKPATMNTQEINSVQAKIGNIFFAEGLMYAYHPQTLKVLELINEGIIGDLISMESNFGINILTKKNFFGFKIKKKINKESRIFNKELGGGAILDLGCYPVSFSSLIGLLNSKKKSDKINVKNIKKELGNTGVDIDSSAELYFENGFKSIIRASLSEDLGQKSIIRGSQGNIILENTWTNYDTNIDIDNGSNKKIHITNTKNIYFYEIEALSKCIIQNKNKPEFPGINLEDTIRNTKILEEWLN